MPVKRNAPAKNIIFWVAAGAVIILLWSLLQTPTIIKSEINFSQFMTDVEAKRVEEVTITGFQVRGQYKDGTTFKTVLPPTYDKLVEILRTNHVNIIVKDANRSPWYTYLFSWFPIILLILFWVFFMRQMQSGGNKAMAFGKSRAKLFSPLQKKVTFKDVAGVEEAKEELNEIGAFLNEPQKFQ